MRDREYTIEKEDGVTRIAVIGSSFSMGSGLAIEEVFHSVLENRLNHEAGENRYEVINFSVGGYNFDMMLGTLRYRALRYEPDLAVFVLTPFTRGYLFKTEKYEKPYKVQAKQNVFSTPTRNTSYLLRGARNPRRVLPWCVAG